MHCVLPLVCVTCPLMAGRRATFILLLVVLHLKSVEDTVLGNSVPHCLLQPCLWQMALVTVLCSRAAGLPHLCLMPCPAKRDVQSAGAFLALERGTVKKGPECRGDKGLLKDLLVGWKAAAAGDGPWATQPQDWLCTPAFPRQAACGGEGGVEGTSFPGLEGWQAWAQGPGQDVDVVGEAPSGAW